MLWYRKIFFWDNISYCYSFQAYEFFLFAGLMFVDMAIFAFMAMKYKYVEMPEEEDDEENLSKEIPLEERKSSEKNGTAIPLEERKSSEKNGTANPLEERKSSEKNGTANKAFSGDEQG